MKSVGQSRLPAATVRPWPWAELLIYAAAAVLPLVAGLRPGWSPIPLDVYGLFVPWRGVLPEPANPLLGDPAMELSLREAVAGAWRSGDLPLWTRTIMSGHPLAADAPLGAFYPVHVAVALLLPTHAGFGLQVVVQRLLAAVFMAVWIRELTPRRLPRIVAALTFVMAGYTQVWLAYPQFMATLAWLPAVAAAWERAARTGSWRAVSAGATAAGMVLLGGQLQFALVGALTLAAYVVPRLVGHARFGFGRRAVGAGLAIACLGLAVGTVSWWPALDLSSDVDRGRWTSETAAASALPAENLVSLANPWRLGGRTGRNYTGHFNANEEMVYVGLIPLVLLLMLPALAARSDFPTLVTPLVLVLGSATGTPPFTLLADLPVVHFVGLVRWLAVWPLAAALAAAMVCDAALRSPGRGIQLFGAGAALTTVVWVMAAPDPPGYSLGRVIFLATVAGSVGLWALRPRLRALQTLLIVGLVAEPGLTFWNYTPAAPLVWDAPLISPLNQIAADAATTTPPPRIAALQTDAIVLGPGVAPRVGLDEVGGYTSMPRASYRRFLHGLAAPAKEGHVAANSNMLAVGEAGQRLLELLNVRYVLSAAPIPAVLADDIPMPECTDWQPLAGEGTTVVRPTLSGVNRIDVRATGAASLEATVRRDGAVVAQGRLPPAGDDSVRTLYFAPVPDSAGSAFEVSLRETDQPAGLTRVCMAASTVAVAVWAEAPALPIVAQANGLYVHANPLALGPAWITPRAQHFPDQATALRALAQRDLDPRQTAIIESTVGDPLARPPGTAAGEASPAGVAPRPVVRHHGANRLSVEANSTGGWLVVSEAYAPGWRAQVNDQPAPVQRAYGGLRAVFVPAGRVRVDMVYRPVPVLAGLLASVIGLAACSLLGLAPRRLGV